jgi:hypothetical protein
MDSWELHNDDNTYSDAKVSVFGLLRLSCASDIWWNVYVRGNEVLFCSGG